MIRLDIGVQKIQRKEMKRNDNTDEAAKQTSSSDAESLLPDVNRDIQKNQSIENKRKT